MDHQKQVDVLITLLEVTASLLKGYKKAEVYSIKQRINFWLFLFTRVINLNNN